jgi:hypothetical protein
MPLHSNLLIRKTTSSSKNFKNKLSVNAIRECKPKSSKEKEQEAANKKTEVGIKLQRLMIAKIISQKAMSKRSQGLKLHFLIATIPKETIMEGISKTEWIEQHLNQSYSNSIY